MQSSFSVIKSNRILNVEEKKISTKYEMPISEMDIENPEEMINDKGVTYEEARKFLDSYEKIGKTIIEDAQKNKEKIMSEACEKASLIEKEAYDKGYEQGKTNGYEDGRKEALEAAKEEAEAIRNEALDVLKSAKDVYSEYLDTKKGKIIDLVFSVCQKVLNREVNENIDITSMVEEALSLSKDEDNIIIKCNKVNVEDLKKNIDLWIKSYNIKNAIYVLPDDSINKGNALIEKDSGIIEVGIEVGLEKIKNALLNK